MSAVEEKCARFEKDRKFMSFCFLRLKFREKYAYIQSIGTNLFRIRFLHSFVLIIKFGSCLNCNFTNIKQRF